MNVIFQFSEIFSQLWEIKVEPLWSARQTEINGGWLWSRRWCSVQCKWRNSPSTICWCSHLGQFMLEDINVALVFCGQHCSPSDHRAAVWALIGPNFPGDVIWCQWFRSGDSHQNIGEDKACSMCARWILLITPGCAPLAGFCLGELFVF